ncbi:MAG: efflux RND transporter periplasmic adaptor subunit [Dokdonella sp.]|nr:MAG: efflux RND transporter periplasmic adaptor subunit [Dokdonella sp.]
MKRLLPLVAGALTLALLAAAGGYWAGQRQVTTHDQTAQRASETSGEAGGKPRKLLYYRNPMGLPDTSPTPKKDPMGMDYLPVYEDDGEDQPTSARQIRISVDKVQKLGVRTEAAQRRVVDRVVRAAGRIEPDERRLYTIAPKFEGYVERLHVSITGQPVGKGQALFDAYSPELVSAQREYTLAVQAAASLSEGAETARQGHQQLAAASLLRLRNWDISEEQLQALARSGEATRTLTLRSPVAGIVSEKRALPGLRFMPGEVLYQVADLSTVWVVADVFEQDIGFVKAGAKAKVRISAYPEKVFTGTISYVYPTLKAETRTIPIRIELPNPGQLLKPAMFAEVELPAGGASAVVTVPASAVIDSGTRRIVLVAIGEGRFEPREVRLGQRGEQYVEVLEGVQDGESVVVAANFLIDAESNLKAALDGFGHAGHAATPKTEAAVGSEHVGHRHDRPATVGHRASGTIAGFDPGSGRLTLSHGPVASLNWPGMTMDFQVANSALLGGLQPGMAVTFEFVERKPGEWVVTGIQAAAGNGGAAARSHAGH